MHFGIFMEFETRDGRSQQESFVDGFDLVEAADALVAYSWPGNVRELKNAVERAVVLGTREAVTVRDLPFIGKAIGAGLRARADGNGLRIVDNTAQQIVKNPTQFDVMVTTNMFGDILSDTAAMLTGSIGMLPSPPRARLSRKTESVIETRFAIVS